jgi:PilZ domain
MAAGKAKKGGGEERRRAKRTVVRESFNLFLVIPSVLGMARFYLRDLSRTGLCFQSELEHGLAQGHQLSARLYLSPAFYLPLECQVVRVSEAGVAVDFLDSDSLPSQAVARLQDFFEAAEKAGVMVE